MSSGLEVTDIVDPWLYAVLTGDAALVAAVGGRISNGAVPAAQQMPLVTWDMISHRDITTSQGLVILSEVLMQVKVVGQGASFVPLKTAASRINALLGMVDNVTTPSGVVSSRRDRIIRDVEVDDQVQYRHLGAVYRITAHT